MSPTPQTPPTDRPLTAGDYESLADLHTIKGWLHGLATNPDLNDVVADGGVTTGDCYQQEARDFAGRIGRILAALASPPVSERERELEGALRDIAQERERQQSAEGWSADHDDDEHPIGQLARAAGCYALSASRDGSDDGFFDCVVDAAIHHSWPWDRSWWKPKDRRRDLVRAGALIVAEIERLDRLSALTEPV